MFLTHDSSWQSSRMLVVAYRYEAQGQRDKVRRYSNDQGRRYVELSSGHVLKGHLSRLEVPPIHETHIRAQSGSYCNIQILRKQTKPPQSVEALGSFVVYTYFKTLCRREQQIAVVERKLYDRKEPWFPYLYAKTMSSSRGAKLILPYERPTGPGLT